MPYNNNAVPLKEHLESRLQAIEKGISVANSAMQERLSGMNEFRDTLRDQASRFITREEIDSKLSSMDARVKDLEKSKALLEGKASQSQVNISLIISVIGIIIAIIGTVAKFAP